MHPRSILILAAAAASAACGDAEPPRLRMDRSAMLGDELSVPGLSSDYADNRWRVVSPNLVRPFAIHALNDSLAVVLDYARPFMHLVDVKRGEYLRPLAQGDAEEREIANVFRLATSPDDWREFAGYDLAANTVTRYRITDDESAPEVLEVIKLNALDQVNGLVWMRGGSMAVESPREGALWAKIGAAGNLRALGAMSLAAGKPEWVPLETWSEAMEGRSCPSPDRSRIARVARYAGQIVILDSMGTALGGSGATLLYNPNFEVRSTGEVVFSAQASNIRHGYLSCGATERFVFALFSGRSARGTTRMRGGGTAIGGGVLHIFDWDGTLRGGFRLQRDAVASDVTPDGSLLVAVDIGRETAISAYEIPRIFRTRR